MFLFAPEPKGPPADAAFEELVRQYSRIVHATAFRHVNDAHLAEDVTQAVFLILHRKLPNLDKNVSILGWLLRAAQFVGRRAAKAESRRRFHEARAVEETTSQTQPNAEEEMLPILGEAILALNIKEQRCVTARFLEELSFRDIAQQEKISEAAAQKRVSRSVEKLRAYLARRGFKVANSAEVSAILTESKRERQSNSALIAAIMRSLPVGHALPSPTLTLAQQIWRWLEWKRRLLIAGTALAIVLLCAVPTTELVINRKPSLPPAAARPTLQRQIVTEICTPIPPPSSNRCSSPRLDNFFRFPDSTRISNVNSCAIIMSTPPTV